MAKIYTIVILLLLPLVLPAQTPEYKEALLKRDKHLYAARPVQKTFTETVAFTNEMNMIIVPVVIEGKTYSFLFDTGAVTIVSPELKDRLGLQELFAMPLTDGADTTNDVLIYRLPQISLGSISFTNVATAAIDLSRFEKLFCIRIDGIFGTNLMRTCHWKINYAGKSVTFSDKAIKPSVKATKIKFTENFSGTPLLTQYLGQYNYQSLMDTGYNGGFSVPDSLFFTSRKKDTAPYRKSTGAGSVTAFESKPRAEYAVAMDSLYVGDFLVKNQVIKAEPRTMALTGNEFFRNFSEVVIDWKKHVVYLPQTPVKEQFALTTYGFNPVFNGDRLEVGMLWEDSAAKREGLEVGDTIITINGESTENMPRDKWCTLLELFKDKTSIQKTIAVATLKKDGSRHTYTLEKYDVFRKVSQ